jgi:predicted DNA repair protein MutK
MAAGSLLALIDDIASVLDDVALMSKVAAKKTAGVLGDDLALNAQQVTGVNADRELPVVWYRRRWRFPLSCRRRSRRC